ncbi:Probable thiol peroxidase [Chlamydiales bacterium SCGC AG-110-P3]|nr:Probable thiol peroxidase [Chlamydiales bacterium SCGC AG-110-P3]
MPAITFKGTAMHTNGELPQVGAKVPPLDLVGKDLSAIDLSQFNGKLKILNIFPSLDTGVCATSVRAFYARCATLEGLIVLNISKDLPFAAGRFCSSEGIDNAVTASAFRSNFASDYGIEIVDGPLSGLCARAVIILNNDNTVLYNELVPEITQEPNYDTALAVATGQLI